MLIGKSTMAFYLANHGAYSNPCTQVGAQKKGFSTVSNDMNRVYRLKELRFLADKLLVIFIVVYVRNKQLRLSLCKKCFLTYYNIRLTSFYSTYDVTLVKWLFYLMINLTSIHSFNIYGRIVSKSWKKMLLIFVEYQKFRLPNRGRYCTQSYITHWFSTIFRF